jgi:hypothetical protein
MEMTVYQEGPSSENTKYYFALSPDNERDSSTRYTRIDLGNVPNNKVVQFYYWIIQFQGPIETFHKEVAVILQNQKRREVICPKK